MQQLKEVIDRQSSISESVNYSKRRLDEHEFILMKFQKRSEIEAEYSQKIAELEKNLDVKLQSYKSQLSKLESVAELTDKRSISLQLVSNNMQERLDIYLTQLRKDIESVTGQNNRLFHQFEEEVKKTNAKYDDSRQEMQKLSIFFENNKDKF